ncbi:MAG TPA: dodecin domain-containing protein [Legionella sp.]|nr:dodecin domain-containing protein [Legionella sp.]
MKSIKDFTGFSESGINEAMQNALLKADNPARFQVIEMRGSNDSKTNRQYQVTLKTETNKK